MADADNASAEKTFETNFTKWSKTYKAPSDLSFSFQSIVRSTGNPGIQYNAANPTFLHRSGEEIKYEFKPPKGIDAAAVFNIDRSSDELRAQSQTKMEDLRQKRTENALPFSQQFEEIQSQLLEAVAEWKLATDTAVKVNAAARIGALQRTLAETDRLRSEAMTPHSYAVAYKPVTEVRVKKTPVKAWRPTAATEEEPAAPRAPAEKRKVDKNGYRLVRSMTDAIDRTIIAGDKA